MSFPYLERTPWHFPSLPTTIHRDSGEIISPQLPALVDTGADATLVPARYLRNQQLNVLQLANIRSYWGEPRTVTIYLVSLTVGGEHLPGNDVVADETGDEIILGPNVLNRLILLLDGIQRQTDLLTRRPRRL
ncbi:MAG: retroviral-like aspartic protease family protein [Caldilineaceae bacterium]|nr:retroviral-like aspartic protease family protein [Caldilineaceae bacterium]